MDITMTGGTRGFAQHRVDALRGRGGLLGVAGGALNFGNFRGMRKISYGSVTVFATKNAMNAGGVFFRADGNIGALFRFHIRLAVAGEASFILLQRLRRLILSAGYDRAAKTNEEDQESSGNRGPSRTTIRMSQTST
jgi:hypothetical protein